MPLILNVETATDVCSVCVSRGPQILSFREAGQSNDHAKVITQLIESCLTEAGTTLAKLDAVAISTGPGSYTSLRVGASTAKGICYAAQKPLIAVSTMKSLAFATQQLERTASLFCPMIDARRMEVYYELFNTNLEVVAPLSSLVVDESSFRHYFEKQNKIAFSGNGATKCKAILDTDAALFYDIVCAAAHLAPLAAEAYEKREFTDMAYFTPMYFKAPNITTPKQSSTLNT